jgi:hypothetical protein
VIQELQDLYAAILQFHHFYIVINMKNDKIIIIKNLLIGFRIGRNLKNGFLKGRMVQISMTIDKWILEKVEIVTK